MSDQQNINSSLLDDMGLGNIPEEKRDELIAKMTEVVLKRIFVETAQRLDSKGQEEYAALLEKKVAPEELEKFLLEKIPDYDAMIKKIVEDFKKEMTK